MIENNEMYGDVNDIDEISRDNMRKKVYVRKFVEEFYSTTRVIRYSDHSQARKRATGKERAFNAVHN